MDNADDILLTSRTKKTRNKLTLLLIVLFLIILIIATILLSKFILIKRAKLNESVTTQSVSLLQTPTSDPNQNIVNEQPSEKVIIDSSKTIFENLTNEPTFSTFLNAVNLTSTAELLNNKKAKYTVFIPTDRAFAKIKRLDLLLANENSDKLKQIVNYHIVNDVYDTKKLISIQNLKTIQGKSINILQDQEKIILDNSSSLISYDMTTSNGIIHVIDTVLNP